MLLRARERRLSGSTGARDGPTGLREANAALSPPRGQQRKSSVRFDLRTYGLPRQSSFGVIGTCEHCAAVERRTEYQE